MCSTTDRIGSVFCSAVAYEFIAGKYVTIIGLVLLLFFVCVVSTQLLSKKRELREK